MSPVPGGGGSREQPRPGPLEGAISGSSGTNTPGRTCTLGHPGSVCSCLRQVDPCSCLRQVDPVGEERRLVHWALLLGKSVARKGSPGLQVAFTTFPAWSERRPIRALTVGGGGPPHGPSTGPGGQAQPEPFRLPGDWLPC